jgi:hypothetical protein
VADDSDVGFGQEFPGEKGSVRWCTVMLQQPVRLELYYCGRQSQQCFLFSHFTHSLHVSAHAVNIIVSCEASFVSKIQG